VATALAPLVTVTADTGVERTTRSHRQEDPGQGQERGAADTLPSAAREQPAEVVATTSSGLRAGRSAGSIVAPASGAVSARRSPRIQQIEGDFFPF
jgi:hypothetical protein